MSPDIAGVNIRGVWWVKALPDSMEKVIYTCGSYSSRPIISAAILQSFGVASKAFLLLYRYPWMILYYPTAVGVASVYFLMWLCFHWTSSVILSSAMFACHFVAFLKIGQCFFLYCFLENPRCCAEYALRMEFAGFFLILFPFIYCHSIFLILLWILSYFNGSLSLAGAIG